MSQRTLKAQLIRLGEERPELRNHLRPVLASLEKRISSFDRVHDLYLEVADEKFIPQVLDYFSRFAENENITVRRDTGTMVTLPDEGVEIMGWSGIEAEEIPVIMFTVKKGSEKDQIRLTNTSKSGAARKIFKALSKHIPGIWR